jgi:hypothetical protein
MKLSFVAVALLVALANARVVPTSDTALEILARDTGLNITYADDTFSDGNEPSTVSTNAEPSKFDKAVEIGRTLDSAMKSKDSVARWFFKSYPNFQDTCQSPFDGDGREELKKWGFDDSDALSDGVKNDCDFDKYHNIKVAFDELGLDTRAKTNGGPNECFKVNHRDGPAEANQYYDVCGKEYRVSPPLALHEALLTPSIGHRSYIRIRGKSKWNARSNERYEPNVLRREIHVDAETKPRRASSHRLNFRHRVGNVESGRNRRQESQISCCHPGHECWISRDLQKCTWKSQPSTKRVQTLAWTRF